MQSIVKHIITMLFYQYIHHSHWVMSLPSDRGAIDIKSVAFAVIIPTREVGRQASSSDGLDELC